MTINVAVYDKNISHAISIRNELEHHSKRFNLDINITLYTYKDELLLDNNKFNTIFISTDFKDNDTTELSKYIRLVNDDINLVYISENQKDAYKIICHQPFAFIRRSLIDIDLPEVLSSLFHKFNTDRRFVTFKTEKSIVNLNINDISYFETFGHVIEINSKDQVIPIRTSLKSLENQFRQFGFVRTHKSYLVNYRYILAVNRQNITLTTKTTLPLGKGKLNEVKTIMKSSFNYC